jgi:hypothetical protein
LLKTRKPDSMNTQSRYQPSTANGTPSRLGM